MLFIIHRLELEEKVRLENKEDKIQSVEHRHNCLGHMFHDNGYQNMFRTKFITFSKIYIERNFLPDSIWPIQICRVL